MLLLHIIKNNLKLKNNTILQLLNLKKYINNLIIKNFLFKQIKKKEQIKSLHFLLGNDKINNTIDPSIQKTDNTIKYVIKFSILITNTLVHVLDIKGKLLFYKSSGSLLKGKLKNRQPRAILNLIKVLIDKTRKISSHEPVALHLKNATKFQVYMIFTILKKIFLIKVIKNFNNAPHNGCRVKKIRRKRKTFAKIFTFDTNSFYKKKFSYKKIKF